MVDEILISKLFLEQSSWGVLVVELRNGKIAFSNSKANGLLLNSDQSLQGRSISGFIPSEKEFSFNPFFFRQDGFFSEVYLRRENESLFPVQILVKTFVAGEDFSLVTLQDISLQKKMQRDLDAKHEGLKEVMKELIEKNDELLLLDKAKTKFLSLVAHELRTPLTAIVATTDVIYHKMYESETEFKDLTKNLYLQTHQIIELVNDILDLTKIHSGLLEFYIEELDPSDIIEKQVSIFTDMALQNSVKISFERPTEPMLCFADSVRLNQIIGNLLSNAIKFNRPNGYVNLGLVKNAEMVEISIEDAGIGIAEDKFASIFNEFETIEVIAQHHKGTGLGLPIVKLLIESLGGKISLKSELTKGTTFFVALPIKKCLQPEHYRSRIVSQGFELFDNVE